MSKTVNVLIVENEFVTADLIKSGLEEIGYGVAGMARSADEALEMMENQLPDIAILDININGDKDGLWLANQIKAKYTIPFIFLTAYSDQKTVKSAIQTKPYGFLIKPFNKVDIYTSIELALKNFVSERRESEASNEEGPLLIDDHLFIRMDHIYRKVVLNEIRLIKSDLKHLELHLEKSKLTFRYTLSEILNILPSDQFIRTHRSYVVNKEFIEGVGPNFVLVNGKEIPMSSNGKEDLQKRFRFI